MNGNRSLSFPLIFTFGTGLALCVTTLFVHFHLTGFEYDDGLAQSPTLFVWIFGGMFVFGAVLAYVSVRYRVVSPVLVGVGIYGLTLATSWSAMILSAQSSAAGITPSNFDFVLWFWPGLLVSAVVVGGIEYGIRRGVSGWQSDTAK